VHESARFEQGGEIPETVDLALLCTSGNSLKNGHPEIGYMLVEHGAQLNLQSLRGVTPLMLAARRDNADMVEVLLDLGADTTRVDTDGRSAADIAATPEIRDVIAKEDMARRLAMVRHARRVFTEGMIPGVDAASGGGGGPMVESMIRGRLPDDLFRELGVDVLGVDRRRIDANEARFSKIGI
jgi:hypothetical protein